MEYTIKYTKEDVLEEIRIIANVVENSELSIEVKNWMVKHLTYLGCGIKAM